MKTNSILCFDVVAEREKRFVVSPQTIYDALDNDKIKITDVIDIEQVWIIGCDKCNGRIRKTTHLLKDKDKVDFEHTVKHHVQKDMDYEINTEISGNDYNLLKRVYRDCKIEQKTRAYVIDVAREYGDYIITIDYPIDKDECRVEFEAKDGKQNKEFKKPEWLEEKN